MNCEQTLSFSLQMQQALHLLQMPLQELAEWVLVQVEQNPALILICPPSPHGTTGRLAHAYDPTLPAHPCSLFEALMQQAREAFAVPEDLITAEWIIGNLDPSGFFSEVIEGGRATAILERIQAFDPPGIGARSLQESMLLQLKRKGDLPSLASRLLREHFDDLLHARFSLLARKLKCSKETLHRVVWQQIRTLDLCPASRFVPQQPPVPIVPDITLIQRGDAWQVEVSEKPLPRFAFCPLVQRVAKDPNRGSDERRTLLEFLDKGRWLQCALKRRVSTLKKVTECLIQRQRGFFFGTDKQPSAMTIQEIAREVRMHESTVGRALSGKYLATDDGIIAMRSLFCPPTSRATPQHLEQLIREEDPHSPLSDEALAHAMQSRGTPCARRTVAKYRRQLKIAASVRRRRPN